MKGLLIKDFYSLTKQMKMFLILIIVFVFMPNPVTPILAIVLSARLPISLIAYDENTKWNYYAAMMPYKSSEIVFSKLLIGFLLSSVTTVLAILNMYVHSLGSGSVVTEDNIIGFIIVFSISGIMLSINLFLTIKFDVVKARLVFYIMTMISMNLGLRFLKDKILTRGNFSVLSIPILVMLIIVSTLFVSMISGFFSMKSYEKKQW